MKCNDPGKADGEQVLWVDGKEAGRWGGIRWRTDPALKVNGIWLLDYITENAAKQNGVKEPRAANRLWSTIIPCAFHLRMFARRWGGLRLC